MTDFDALIDRLTDLVAKSGGDWTVPAGISGPQETYVYLSELIRDLQTVAKPESKPRFPDDDVYPCPRRA